MFGKMFNGMFGMVEPGLCRLSMSGNIAVKTSSGYKSYDLKKKRLTNCTGFCFNVGEEFFFVIPTNHAEIGDIILVNGKPKCVTKVNDSSITVVDYEDSSIKEILPERHVFMGNTYFYGKIVSMFGNLKSGKGMKQMLKMMMMASMFNQMNKGNDGSNLPMVSANANTNFNMQSMFPMMMLFGGGTGAMGDVFEGMFDGFSDNVDSVFDDEEETEKEEKKN